MSDVAACPALGSLRAALVRATVASAGTVLVVVAFLGRYGWDRDELYFLSASKRPTWGYVDFPPLTAWLAWGVRQLAGDSLVALRLTCLAAGVGTTFFVVLIARELGGGGFGQLVAGFAWSLCPYVLGSASIFHPTWLDALAWSAVVYLATRILVRPEPRLWPLLGLVAGIGLEAKYTMAFLLAGLGLALLLFDRRLLRTGGPWVALAIAVALLVPNLVWQAQHGWPSVAFASSQNAKSAADTPPPTYVIEQVLFLGGVFVLSVLGVVWLWRRRLRVLAALPVILFVVFLVERGRAYYAMPAYVVAAAAGGVALEQAGRRRRWVALIAVFQVAVCVVAVPAIVPVLPERLLISTGEWKVGFFKDEIGWPELTHQTEAVWLSLPAAERANGAVLAKNYGEAAALEHYGHKELPLVVSGHLSWQYWRPRLLPQRYLVTVGVDPATLDSLCSSWHAKATIDNHAHLDNEERGRTIDSCTLRQPLGTDWAQIASNTL